MSNAISIYYENKYVILTPDAILCTSKTWWPETECIFLGDITAIYEGNEGLLVASGATGIWLPRAMLTTEVCDRLIWRAPFRPLVPLVTKNTRMHHLAMLLLGISAGVLAANMMIHAMPVYLKNVGHASLCLAYPILAFAILASPLKPRRVKLVAVAFTILTIGAAIAIR